MPPDLLAILSQLKRVRPTGRNKWNACCPAHDDKNPSMLVWIGPGDRVMFHCSFGCDWKSIHAALGIRQARVSVKWEPQPRPIIDFEPQWRKYKDATTLEQLQQYAALIGVTVESLKNLEAAWADCYQAMAFPMRDGMGKIIGLRLRNSEGRKWAATGSRSGLFIPRQMHDFDPLLIVEGPTDCAAALTMGFDAIGRPSCNDGTLHIVEYLKRHRREVVILSNLDKPHTTPDGRTVYPGQDGAEKLANEIVYRCKKLRIILPPPGIKDTRAWLAAGGTRKDIEEMIASRRNWRKS